MGTTMTWSEGGSWKWQRFLLAPWLHLTATEKKTHLKLIFFNYLELFVSNAKWVYSLWHRVSWALSKNFFQHRSSGSKLLTKLNFFHLSCCCWCWCVHRFYFLMQEKLAKKCLCAIIFRFKWLCCTQCHSYLVDIVECFLIVCFHYIAASI